MKYGVQVKKCLFGHLHHIFLFVSKNGEKNGTSFHTYKPEEEHPKNHDDVEKDDKDNEEKERGGLRKIINGITTRRRRVI